MTSFNYELLAPGTGGRRAWTGKSANPSPRTFPYTVVIPHLNTPEILDTCLALWRLANPAPFIMVMDTGSEDIAAVEALRAPDLEVHHIRSHSWEHASEPVAAAMDMASLLCPTRWMLATHSDCFLRERNAFPQLHRLADTHKRPCVGYQISPRPAWGDCWRTWVGHTFTLFDRDFLDELDLTWSLRRGVRRVSGVHLREATEKPTQTALNVIDTEVYINQALIAAGHPPLIIGGEENYQRNITPHFDHVRSYGSAQLYVLPEHELRKNQEQWLAAALREAEARIAKWNSQ